jgi:hypothetical protein
MGFITATVLGVPLAYIFGGNPNQQKKLAETGTTTAEFTASVKTEPLTDKENGTE